MDAQKYLNEIKGRFPGTADAAPERIKDGVPALLCPAPFLFEIVKYLKAEGFNYLMDLCATDYRDSLEVIYHFCALETNVKLTVKVRLDREKPELASITPLYPGADWQEREAFDLLGINFPGHPDLKNLLLPCGWEGHPLRKDYSRKPDQYD